jgi:hypothetical protein
MADRIRKDGSIGRRGFFGAVAATSAGVLAGGARPVLAEETGDERTKARYQENSDDVQAFYRTNRYYTGE